ncbi:hypothetical protein DL89DRAFT_266817, partial [Linderina pennispora]
MNIILSAAKLVQLAVLGCAGCLLLQSLFMSTQTFLGFFYPTIHVPYLNPVSPPVEITGPISLAWQKSFEYEAKVYLSSKSCRSNSLETFLQNATEVWHIEPQSLVNRYPVFEKHLSLDFTDTTWMFMCLFIQKAGQFTPHPNISDPHLLVNEHVLAYTTISSTCYGDNQKGKGIKAHCVSNTTFMVETQAKWKIHLEDNVYTPESLPRRRCSKCNIIRRQSLDSDNTTDSAGSKGMYLPLLYMDWDTKSESAKFPLTDSKSTDKGTDYFNTSIGISMGVRGVRTSTEIELNHITNTPEDKALAALRRNEDRPFMPHMYYKSPTAKSSVSTAIYLALYPVLLSLYILRQLSIAKLYFASACSNREKASSILRMYLLVEHLGSSLFGRFVLFGNHAGLNTAFLNAYSTWWYIKSILAVLPQRRVASTIRYLAGSRATNTRDNTKDGEPLQSTKENEGAEAESTYTKSASSVFKLFFWTVFGFSIAEYADQACVSGSY